MTDTPKQPHVEAPKQPHIDTAIWHGSTAEIYDPQDLFSNAQVEGITIYDRSDFGTPLERARLSMEPVQTLEGEPAVGISAIIQLDRSTTEMKKYVAKFKEKFKPYDGKAGDDMEVLATPFSNTFIVVDHKNGVKMMVGIAEDGTITLSNQRRAEGSNRIGHPTSSELHAPAAHTVDGPAQLRGASRILMRVLDRANGVTNYDGNTPLKRTYRVGEQTSALAYSTNTVRSLGARSLKGSVARRPSDSSSTPSRDALEQELGIKIDGEDEMLLDDIGGLAGVKAKLRDIAISFKNPEVMAKWGAERPQGILLYGEPGTGKTMLAQALANEIGAELWKIQGSDIYDMWLGNSEAKIKEIFTKARQLKVPTVILFDEFDSIIGTTDEPGPGGGGQARNGVAGIFKQEMNDLAKENPNVLMIAITNNPDRIDSALVRSGRFDHRIYVPMPDDEGRTEIISSTISRAIMNQEGTDFQPFADGIDIGKLAQATDGMSGADITEIFRRVNLQKAMQEARTGSVEPISHEDLEATIRDFRTQG